MSRDNKKMPISELLSHATVRLECISANGSVSRGTGFFMEFLADQEKGKSIPVVVTNKHVIEGSDSVRLVLTEMIDGEISNKNLIFDFAVSEKDWIKHPDKNVDLCAMPIASILKHVKLMGKSVVYTTLGMDIVATVNDLNDYWQLDEVVMIGYPDALWDATNNQPIFRKGIIATNPSLDYNGTSNFLVDMPVFNGSSGSPIIVVREGVYYDRKTGRARVATGPLCTLLGVLHSGHVHPIDGKIVARPIPAAYVPIAESLIPNNLGIVVKAPELYVLEKAVKDFADKHS